MFFLLQSTAPDSPKLSEKLAKKRIEDRKFIEQLLDTSLLEDYKVPVSIKAELRPYQQVQWVSLCWYLAIWKIEFPVL